jgi:hypothetical protein
MDIAGYTRGKVVVDDMWQLRDINTTRDKVGCDNEAQGRRRGGECSQGLAADAGGCGGCEGADLCGE